MASRVVRERRDAYRVSLETARTLQRTQRLWTPERIIGAIRRFVAQHGRPPTSTERACQEIPAFPSVGVVCREFGTWNAAIEAAGFEPRRRGQRLS
jgi:hypothetical protein